MTTEHEINEQIQRDYEAYYNSVYQHELPDSIYTLFKRAFMALAPEVHQIRTPLLRTLEETPANLLTVAQVGIMINVIVKVPLGALFTSYEKAITVYEEIDALKIQYNKEVDDLQRKINLKKQTLMKLGGINNSASFRKN